MSVVGLDNISDNGHFSKCTELKFREKWSSARKGMYELVEFLE